MSKYVGNAKLRELLCGDEAQRRIASIGEDVTPTYHSTGSVDEHSNVLLDVADLLDENAKLRELAKRMHYQIKQTCDECDGYYCSNFDEDNECCVYDTLLRELGVETDE